VGIVVKNICVAILETAKPFGMYNVIDILAHEYILEATARIIPICPNIFFSCFAREKEESNTILNVAPAAFAGLIWIKNTADLKIVNDRIKAEIDTNVVSAIFERILAFQLLHPVIMASTR
jgi:hypothetical protein